MSHNSIEGQMELPFRLTGSQAKTAYALRLNCELMCKEAGIARIGFLTLTVGESEGETFKQIWDASEASRRVNSLRPVIASIFEKWIIVTERHKNGAIHFHLVGVVAADIRTGFDHEALRASADARAKGSVDAKSETRCWNSASPALREIWAMLRETLPKYGFGRAELTPIRKSGEEIACYVSKYVEKNLFNRLADDVGRKLVRYGGWEKKQLKPNDFSWATPAATAWRIAAQACALAVGIKRKEGMAEALGPRWAWKVTKVMQRAADIGSPYKCEAIDRCYFRECIVADMKRAMDSHVKRMLLMERIDNEAMAVRDDWFDEQGRVLL